MLTLNETRTQLRVGRRRLMNLLDELQIEPIQIHARRQEISEEQFDKFIETSKNIAELPLYIDETPAISIAALSNLSLIHI